MIHDAAATAVYHLSKRIRRGVPLDRHASGLQAQRSADAHAEAYFLYKERKGKEFDSRFGFDPTGKVVLDVASGLGGYMCHALRQGAAFAYGVELNTYRYEKSIELLQRHWGRDNFKVVHGDARRMTAIEAGSVDAIVSDATLEHIRETDLFLEESARILRRGARAYLSTSPMWYTWNGGHLWRQIPLPWSHLLLSDVVIHKVLEKQLGDASNAQHMQYKIDQYRTLARLTIRKLRREIAQSDLHLVAFSNHSNSELKKVLTKVPLLDELFAGTIMVTLER